MFFLAARPPAFLVFFFLMSTSSWIAFLLFFSVPPPPLIAHPEPPTCVQMLTSSCFLMIPCFQIRLPENPHPVMVPSSQVRLPENSSLVLDKTCSCCGALTTISSQFPRASITVYFLLERLLVSKFYSLVVEHQLDYKFLELYPVSLLSSSNWIFTRLPLFQLNASF